MFRRLRRPKAANGAFAEEDDVPKDEFNEEPEDDMQSGRLVPTVAGGGTPPTAATASAGMVTPPPAATPAAGDEGMMDRMSRFMEQIPGTSPSGTPLTTPPGRLEGDSTEPLSGMDRRQRELYARQQQLLPEQRTTDQEKLLAAIGCNLGFHDGRPVAALTIFRCCLQWRTFQVDRTPLLDRIIATMGSQVELHHEDNAMLAYWLSNTVTLLYLMQKNVKPASGGGYAARIKASSQQVKRGLFGSSKGSFTSFFTRTGYGGGCSPGQGMEAPVISGALGGFRQEEAKYPALLFKQQLDALVQKIFPMLRDNVKKEISPLLAACIHAPRQEGARGARRITSGAAALPAAAADWQRPATPGTPDASRPSADGEAAGGLSPHWASMLRVFDGLLATLRENHVPPFLVQKLFEQLLSFVNVQLFNQLLLRRECCSYSNGEYVTAGLSEVEQWLYAAGEEWLGESWNALAHIRQAVAFLVTHQKHRKSFREITEELCGSLSLQQLYRISTMYWDDRYNAEAVSPEVLAQMRKAMQESSSSAASHSFLLDNDSAIPFTHANVEHMVDDRDLLGETPVPKQLQGEPSFSFLRKPLEVDLATSDSKAISSSPANHAWPKESHGSRGVAAGKASAEALSAQPVKAVAAQSGRAGPAGKASAEVPSAQPVKAVPAQSGRAGPAGEIPAEVLSAQRDHAVAALIAAAVEQRLPVVSVPLGLAGALSIPLSSWLLCESLIRWAGAWQPGEIVTAAHGVQRAIVDAADSSGLRGQAYWLACTLAAGGLLKFRTVGRREYSHLLRLSDALINCTPVHEALGDSISEALPISVAVLLSDDAKRGDAAQSPWRALLGGVSNVLEALRAEGVPAPAVRAVSWACLRYIDGELLNALLLRRDCCSVSAAKALQAGLAKLRGWVAYVGDEWCCGPEEAEAAMERVTQAAQFLVQGKDDCIRKAYRGVDMVADLARSCPALSLQQVYRLSEHQHDDWLGSKGASERESMLLLETLKRLMAEQRARMGSSQDASRVQGYGANPLYDLGTESEEEATAQDEEEEEEDLLVEPREAFVLPWRVLTEAARCFVQPPVAPAGSKHARVGSLAPAARTGSAAMLGAGVSAQPTMSTLVLLDAIGQACLAADLPAKLLGHPEFDFLESVEA